MDEYQTMAEIDESHTLFWLGKHMSVIVFKIEALI